MYKPFQSRQMQQQSTLFYHHHHHHPKKTQKNTPHGTFVFLQLIYLYTFRLDTKSTFRKLFNYLPFSTCLVLYTSDRFQNTLDFDCTMKLIPVNTATYIVLDNNGYLLIRLKWSVGFKKIYLKSIDLKRHDLMLNIWWQIPLKQTNKQKGM